MNDNELKPILEALLMSSSQPLSIEQMALAFEEGAQPEKEQCLRVLSSLAQDYEHSGVELKAVATGYLFQTRAKYSPWIARMQAEKPAKYSKAFIETLAIIAYKQPVTRGDIEDIRGVSVNTQVIKTLLDRHWIRIAGHRDVPGKPAVYTTTNEFLDHFNLKSLKELPLLPDIQQVFGDNVTNEQTECQLDEQ